MDLDVCVYVCVCVYKDALGGLQEAFLLVSPFLCWL